jgi:hypothetical protein
MYFVDNYIINGELGGRKNLNVIYVHHHVDVSLINKKKCTHYRRLLVIYHQSGNSLVILYDHLVKESRLLGQHWVEQGCIYLSKEVKYNENGGDIPHQNV